FAFGNCACSFPWPMCAGLAPGMGQLHSGDAPLFMNEADDSSQHLDVPVCPDAEVLRTDASLGKNGRCLSKYQSGATGGATPEMNEMPVVSVSVVARVLTHRRDEYPIGKFYFSNRERIKQAGHGQRLVTRTERMSKVQFVRTAVSAAAQIAAARPC